MFRPWRKRLQLGALQMTSRSPRLNNDTTLGSEREVEREWQWAQGQLAKLGGQVSKAVLETAHAMQEASCSKEHKI